MRADLNGNGLERPHFAIIPFRKRFLTCFLTNETQDLAYTHHLREIAIPSRIVPLYLFVRFAWSIFQVTAPTFSRLGKAVTTIPVNDIVRGAQAEYKPLSSAAHALTDDPDAIQEEEEYAAFPSATVSSPSSVCMTLRLDLDPIEATD